MSVDYTVIGRRIQQKRKACAMTQEELAEALTVTVGYVSQMERGVTKISLDRLVSGAVPAQEDYLAREMDELYQRMDKGQRRLLLALGKTILEQEEC